MKLLGILLILLLGSSPLSAQEAPPETPSFGGYGGPFIAATAIDGELGVLVGGSGVFLLSHHVGIGMAGCGLVNDVAAGSLNEPRPNIDFGYGGLVFQYIHGPDMPLRVSAGLLVAGGDVSYDVETSGTGSEPGSASLSMQDGVFVLEPMAELEVRLVEFLHVSVAGSYRIVSGVALTGMANEDLSGPAGRVMLKLGRF